MCSREARSSHILGEGAYPAAMMRVREPIERPLDVIAAEVGVTVSQALLAGLLAHLATGFWAERGVATGSVVAIFTLAALAIAGAWLYWLLGGDGWPMAIACMPVGLVLAFALVLNLRGAQFDDLNVGVTLVAIGCAAYGVVAGFFLDSPRRWRWNQRRAPRAGSPVPRLSPTGERIVRQVRRVRVPRPPRRRKATPRVRVAVTAEASPTPAPESQEAASVRVVRMASPRPSDAHAGSERRSQVSVRPPAPSPNGSGDDAPPVAVVPRSGVSEPRPDAVTQERLDLQVPEPEPRDGIDLPTSDEPRARRSPWAWASPPEWSRDDFDDDSAPPGARGSR
jgi:hypothetical protein